MRKTLAGIPTLPDQFRDRILKARAAQQAGADDNMRNAIFYETLDKERYGFSVLALLKTPASIRVLGDFLTDHRGAYDPEADKRPNDPRGDFQATIKTHTSNSQYAVMQLMASALEDKPLVVKYDTVRLPTRDQIAVWERWYGRIKAGQATFRFEGDPTEYDLDGPASPEKLARLRANRERDEALEKRRSTAANRTGGPISNDYPPPSGASAHLPWPGLLAGSAAVLAALGWYFLRRGKPHAG